MKLSPVMLGRRLGRFANSKSFATFSAGSMLSAGLVVAAVRSEGIDATSVYLNDGSVWVTNGQMGQLGRLNIAINEMDFFRDVGQGVEVIQDGRNVLFQSPDLGVRTVKVDTGNVSGDNKIVLTNYQVGGGVGLVHDPETGKLWTGQAGEIVAPEYPREADARLELGSRVVVTAGEATPTGAVLRGRVFVLDSKGWYEVALGDDFKPVRPVPEEGTADTVPPDTTPALAPGDTLPDPEPQPLPDPAHTQVDVQLDEVAAVTMVGDVPVVLTSDGNVVSETGRSLAIEGESRLIQPPGPKNNAVLVASTAGLFEIDLKELVVEKISEGDELPAAPVRVGTCAFGAWSGDTNHWSQVCNGAAIADFALIEGAKARSQLVWRVNQANVALNSTGDGGVWAEHAGSLAFVGNWSDAAEDDQNQQDTATGESEAPPDEQCNDGGNEPPIAGDDEQIGVRPRPTIIDVLYNDSDKNCEPFAIVEVDPSEQDAGTLSIIDNGQHLLYSPSDEWRSKPEARPPFSFTYVIQDGSGAQSEPATATINLRPYDQNFAPELRPKGDKGKTREMRTSVEENQTVSYDVIADWYDRDGDDLRVTNAIAIDGAGTITFTPEGVVKYIAAGVSPGDHKVAVTMSDGYAAATAELTVSVQPRGQQIKPETSADFLTLAVGQTGTVHPLANDSDGNGDKLQLVPTWNDSPNEAYSAQHVVSDNSIKITAAVAGLFPIRYGANDGLETVDGTVLLRVVAPSDGVNRSPIAVPDRVSIRPLRVIDVDVLDNDVELDGDVLAVTAATTEEIDNARGGVRATVVDRRMVQLEVVPGTDLNAPLGPFQVTYTIEDGYEEARAAAQGAEGNEISKLGESARRTGVITVLVQSPDINRPPVVVDDRDVVVRDGDVVAIPVLRNDTDPDGDPLELRPLAEAEVARLAAEQHVFAWTEGRFLFVQGQQPTVTPLAISYDVHAAGQAASGTAFVTVTVAGEEAFKSNRLPEPDDLELRAIRGGTVRLKIPTSMVDPDGDQVRLVDGFSGYATGNKVELVDADEGVLQFVAGAPKATTVDTFTYSVQDRYGARASANVRILIVDDPGWKLQAHDDTIRAKPGRTVIIPVLANDVSPQDRALRIADPPFFDALGAQSATPVAVESVKLLADSEELHGRIEIVVPDAGTLVERYRVTDGFGDSAASLRVTTDPAAPNLPPIAPFDRIESSEVAKVEVIERDVMSRAYDPDGSGAIRLEPLTNQDYTVKGDRTLAIPILEGVSRTVLYRIVDAEGAEAIGRIFVPGRENHPPQLREDLKSAPLETVPADETVTIPIDLSKITIDPDGDSPIVLTENPLIQPSYGEVVRRKGSDSIFDFTYTGQPLKRPEEIEIGFQVTDRTDLKNDATQRSMPGCNCVSDLVVHIVLDASAPPVVSGVGNVEVPLALEPTAFDLATLVTDPDGDPLTYTIMGSAPAGLKLTQTNSKLVLESISGGENQQFQVGSTARLNFEVSDGKFDPVLGSVVVTIIASNRPTPATGLIPVQNAERDFSWSLTTNLLSNSFNPFAVDGKPLTLVSFAVDGGGNATLNCDDTGRCDFMATEPGNYAGTYVIGDFANRKATGQISFVVKGKPLAPSVPQIKTEGDQEVAILWTEAPDTHQGGTLRHYEVQVVEMPGNLHIFKTTSGTVKGLKNNTEYHFIVRAVNEIGNGEWSEPSSGAKPDRVPDPPINLSFDDYSDGTITVSWQPPLNDGADFSPITDWEITVAGTPHRVPASQTSITLGKNGLPPVLSNGTSYDVSIRAKNSLPDWGPPTSKSGAGIDFSMPSTAPQGVTGVVAGNSGDGGTPRMTVSWNAVTGAAMGGRPVVNYHVCRIQAPATCQDVGTATQATFDEPGNVQRSYSVMAVSADKNTPNAPVVTSTTLTTLQNPATPSIAGVSVGDHQLTVSPGGYNNTSGCGTVVIEYTINGGVNWQTGTTFGGLQNGQSYSAQARARLDGRCDIRDKTYQSGVSGAVSGTPVGPLLTPSISASGGGTGSISWSWNAPRGDDGRTNWRVSITGDCPNNSNAPSSGSTSINPGLSGRSYFCRVTVTADGATALQATASATTGTPPPNASIQTYNTGVVAGNCNSTCTRVGIRGSNFAPNSALQVLCAGDSRWFRLGSSNSGGSFDISPAECWHAAGTPQLITVRDASGNEASQVSSW